MEQATTRIPSSPSAYSTYQSQPDGITGSSPTTTRALNVSSPHQHVTAKIEITHPDTHPPPQPLVVENLTKGISQATARIPDASERILNTVTETPYQYKPEGMENPTNEIAHATNKVINASSPENQVLAIERYFSPDAGLSHPLCHIASTPTSRERVARAYMALQIIAPGSTAKIRRQAFNDVKGKMTLEMDFNIPAPLSRLGPIGGLLHSLGIQKGQSDITIPVHVFLNMRRDLGGAVGSWKIYKQEVVFQPVDVFNAFGLIWVGDIIYWVLWLFLIVILIFGQLLRLWPHKDVSVIEEAVNVVNEGLEVILLPPVDVARGSISLAAGKVGDAVGKVEDGVEELKRSQVGRIVAVQSGWRFLVWKLVHRIVYALG